MLPIEDTAAYYKYWLRKVSLQSVIERRLAVLSKKVPSGDVARYISVLEKVIHYPVRRKRHPRGENPNVLTDLVSGVTGNNIRDGLELFCDMIRTHSQDLLRHSADGFLRTDSRGRDYVAEYVAVRGMFLVSPGIYRFRDGLVNFFDLDGVEGHGSVLLQTRIVEILLKRRIVPLSEAMRLLCGLRYPREDVVTAFKTMRASRLVSVFPHGVDFRNPGNEAIVQCRHRGRYYYETLARRLSYIQMVYFMSSLPSCCVEQCGYPRLPDVETSQLAAVVENFLRALWIDIAREADVAEYDALSEYTEMVANPWHIHEHVTDAYGEVLYIMKEGRGVK
jgi:hypothetical protein